MPLSIRVKAIVIKSLIENRSIPEGVILQKTGINADDFQRFITTDSEIEYKTLELLSKILGKPWTCFLLEEPEKPVKFDQDNRTLENRQHGLGIALVKALIDAEFTLRISHELEPSLKVRLPITKASLDNNPQDLGERFRRLLGITQDETERHGDARAAFSFWKELIQNRGVYIAEKPLPLDQVRAFSLIRDNRAIIVLSTKDSYQARTFSLFHELAHILLKSTGICDMSAYAAKVQEQFCNRFAAAFLAPTAYMDVLIKQLRGEGVADDEMAFCIAQKLKISKAATAIRLIDFGITSNLVTLDFEALAKQKKTGRTSGGNYYATAINAAGVRFSKQVFSALSDGQINARDAARFLGVGEKSVGSFRTRLYTYHPEK